MRHAWSVGGHFCPVNTNVGWCSGGMGPPLSQRSRAHRAPQQGKLKLTDPYTVQSSDLVPDSDIMGGLTPGVTRLTLRDLATMMVASTASSLIHERVSGWAAPIPEQMGMPSGGNDGQRQHFSTVVLMNVGGRRRSTLTIMPVSTARREGGWD